MVTKGRRWTAARAGLIAGACALVVAACGSGDDDAESVVDSVDDASDEPTTSDDATTSDDDDGADAAEPADSGVAPATTESGDGGDPAAAAPTGVVRAAPSVSLITLDPHNFIGGGLPWLTPVYETLFQQVFGGDETIQPMLATGYEIDGLTVTITLRDDVTFTDGEPFDAAAVKANLERGQEIGVRPEFAPIEAVTVIDDHTVEIALTKESPSFITDLATIPGMMISPAALDDPALDRNPVGTGPWVYDASESVEGEVHVYTINDMYWDPSAQGVERIEIYDIADQQARVNALKTGQIDHIVIDGTSADEVDADGNLGLVQRGYGSSFGVPILDRAGTVVEAFGSQQVRQAMSLAIDREAFVDAVSFGRAIPTIQPAPPGHWAHNDEVHDTIDYDPDRARELMSEAGFPDGFAFTMPSIPGFAASIEVLGEFWRDIGIEVEVEALEPGTLAGRSRTTDFPATMLLWRTGSDMSLFVPTYLAEDATFNPFGVTPNPRVLELDAEGASSTDASERAPAYQELAAIVADELPVIYVAAVESLFGTTAELADNPTLRYNAGQSEAPIWHGLRLDG